MDTMAIKSGEVPAMQSAIESYIVEVEGTGNFLGALANETPLLCTSTVTSFPSYCNLRL